MYNVDGPHQPNCLSMNMKKLRKFLRMVSFAVEEHNIPQELVVNVDKTGLHVSKEKESSQKVKIEGMDDKRELWLGFFYWYAATNPNSLH